MRGIPALCFIVNASITGAVFVARVGAPSYLHARSKCATCQLAYRSRTMGNVCGTTVVSGADRDSAERIFADLDRNCQGYLTLKELMNSSSYGLIMPHSLPALYFIDEEKNGRITREQFISFFKLCQEEKQKAYDSACRDKKFRDVISRASAAGVRDCSVPCRTRFRRFRSYSNVRSVFCRHPNNFTEYADLSAPATFDTEDTSVTESHPGNGTLHIPNNNEDSSHGGSQSKEQESSFATQKIVHFTAHEEEYKCPVSGPSLSDSSSARTTDQAEERKFQQVEDLAYDCSPRESVLEDIVLCNNSDSERVPPETSEKAPDSDENSASQGEYAGSCASQNVQNNGSAEHDSDTSDSGYDSDDEGALCNHDDALDQKSNDIVACETWEPLTAQSSTAMDAAVTQTIAEMNIHKLADLLHTDGSREHFMQWLWKLVDFNSTGIVTLEELRVFLAALSEDGIDLDELAFYKDCAVSLEECIINEFDTTHTGVLEQDEFLVLADLVTREYAHWESRHLECIGDYELGRTVGRGSSGIVRMGVNVQSHEKYAVKIIRKGKCADMSGVDREIQALQTAKHPHIVALEEVLETEDSVFLVLELCGGGSLSDVVRLYPEERMPERTARFYLRQVFDALSFCHELGICHRDVRLDNLLLDNRGTMKITDFGHCKMFPGKGWDFHTTMLVGSIHNLSPEQVAGQVYSGEKIDIWSCGVAVYSLLVGHPPFMDQDCVKLLEDITTGTFDIPDFVSPEAANLIRCMIRVCPDERVPLSELMEHPWFYSGDSYGPDMDIYSIPVDAFFLKRPDLAEMIMAGTIHEHNLHFHLADTLNPKSPPEDLRGQAWSLKCLCPQMDIKFSVSLFTKEPTTFISPNRLQTVSSSPRMQGHTRSNNHNGSCEQGASDSPGISRNAVLGERDAEGRNDCRSGGANYSSGSESDNGSIRYVFDEESARDEFGQSLERPRTRRSHSLDGDNGLAQSSTANSEDVAKDFASNPPALYDAFPYQKVFPRKEMPEAAKQFDSDERIAAAAAESVAHKPAIVSNLQRSKTIEGVAHIMGVCSGDQRDNSWSTPIASITQRLEKYPAKAHNSQSPMPHARSNVTSPAMKPITCDVDDYPLLPSSYADNAVECRPADMGNYRRISGICRDPTTAVCKSDFQPYIEVRLRCGESGLFRRICHKLKTICDTKLAAAAESQRRRSASRRSASASISEFRRTTSNRSIALA